MRWIEAIIRGAIRPLVDPIIKAWKEYRAKAKQQKRRKDALRVRSADDATSRMRERSRDEHGDE